jgi:hypothetical protein
VGSDHQMGYSTKYLRGRPALSRPGWSGPSPDRSRSIYFASPCNKNHLPAGVRLGADPNSAGEDDPSRATIRPAIFARQSGNGSTRLRVEKCFDPGKQWRCSLPAKQGKSFLVGTGTFVVFGQQDRLIFATRGKSFAAELREREVDLEAPGRLYWCEAKIFEDARLGEAMVGRTATLSGSWQAIPRSC